MTHGIKLKFANGFSGVLTIISIAPRCPSARNYLAMVSLNLIAMIYAMVTLIGSGGKLVHSLIIAAIIVCLCAQVLIFTYSIFLMRIGPILTLSRDRLWLDSEGFIYQQGKVQTHFSWDKSAKLILHSNLGYIEIQGEGETGKIMASTLSGCTKVCIPLRFAENRKIIKEFSKRIPDLAKSQERVFEGDL